MLLIDELAAPTRLQLTQKGRPGSEPEVLPFCWGRDFIHISWFALKPFFNTDRYSIFRRLVSKKSD